MPQANPPVIWKPTAPNPFTPFRHHVGLEYTHPQDGVVSDYQLLDVEDRAVATIQYTDGELTRPLCAVSYLPLGIVNRWAQFCYATHIANVAGSLYAKQVGIDFDDILASAQ